MNEIDIFVTQLCMVWQLTLVVMEMKYKLVPLVTIFLVVNGVVNMNMNMSLLLLSKLQNVYDL